MPTEPDELGIERATAQTVQRANILALFDNIKFARMSVIEDWRWLGENFTRYQDELVSLQTEQESLQAEQNSLSVILQRLAGYIRSIRNAWVTIAERYLLDYYKSSGALSGNGQVRPTAGWLGGMVVNTDGKNDAILTLYDSVIGSGKQLYRIRVAGGDNQGGKLFGSKPVQFLNGCTRKLWGTNATCIIYYR